MRWLTQMDLRRPTEATKLDGSFTCVTFKYSRSVGLLNTFDIVSIFRSEVNRKFLCFMFFALKEGLLLIIIHISFVRLHI